jgi:hypothetical protein
MGLMVSFQGLDADKGIVEAFAGIESAAGIARCLTLIAHYAATGEVRYRYPFSDNVQFYLKATEEGSFNWRLVLAVTGPLALGLSTNAIYDLSKLVLTKAIGGEVHQISPEVEKVNEQKSGDIDALVEAVEPALKKGHYGIGSTISKIEIIESTSKRTVVHFNEDSKRYLSDSINADTDVQDVSISALNANDRTGRAYFLDLRRTIPFRIDRDADPKLITILSANLDKYVNRNPAPTRIKFKRVEAVDGRLKRIVIYDAEDISFEE